MGEQHEHKEDPQDPKKLAIIDETEDRGDPEYMTLEDNGQESFDSMWQEGDTINEDGYLLRPLEDDE